MPIVEQVAEFLETALGEITEDAGYEQTLSVNRPKRAHYEGDLTDDLSTMVYTSEPTEQRDLRVSGSRIVHQEYEIVVFVIDSDDESDSIETRLSQVAADIAKKLALDRTCGGLADWLKVTAAVFEPADDDGNYSCMRMTVTAHLDVDDTDPYYMAWRRPYSRGYYGRGHYGR